MPRLVSARAHACENGLGNRGPLRLSLGKIMHTWIVMRICTHLSTALTEAFKTSPLSYHTYLRTVCCGLECRQARRLYLLSTR